MLIQWSLLHNPAHNISITGQVPGSMYTALMDHQIIQDPYYRDNDIRYRWIGLADWTYSRTFNGGSFPAQRDKVGKI